MGEKENENQIPSTGGKPDKRIIQESQNQISGREFFEDNKGDTSTTPPTKDNKDD